MDRSVAPGPRRMRLAWHAGIRSRSRWLVAGVLTLVIAGAFDAMVRYGAAVWRSAWARVESGQLPGSGDLAAVTVGWGLVLAIALIAVVVGHGLGGSLGPVDGRAADRLGPIPLRGPALGTAVLAIVVGAVLAASLGSVVAGAARAADAPQDVLFEVWQIWLVRGLTIGGLALIGAGLIETLLWRRRITLALYQSVERARAEQRRGGSARR